MLNELLHNIITQSIPKRNSILFVDDEIICHDVVNLVLGYTTNYKVVNTYNAAEAIILAEKFNKTLGLIFIDILLSDMNGYQLYKILKANENIAHIPIVFQSGITVQIREIRELIENQQADIIHKPYKNDELINIVGKYMPK